MEAAEIIARVEEGTGWQVRVGWSDEEMAWLVTGRRGEGWVVIEYDDLGLVDEEELAAIMERLEEE